MLICDNCKEHMRTKQSENTRSFPAFTVAGGLIGTVGSLVGGPLLLVPAAVVAGALADTAARNCGMCGKEISEDEPSYHLMEELGDEYGGLTYRPVAGSQGPAPQFPQRSYSKLAERDGFNPGRSEPLIEGVINESPEECSKRQPQAEHVFDEVEGKLVLKDIPSNGTDSAADLINGTGHDIPTDAVMDNQSPGQDIIDSLGFGDFSGFEGNDLADGDSFDSPDGTLF